MQPGFVPVGAIYPEIIVNAAVGRLRGSGFRECTMDHLPAGDSGRTVCRIVSVRLVTINHQQIPFTISARNNADIRQRLRVPDCCNSAQITGCFIGPAFPERNFSVQGVYPQPHLGVCTCPLLHAILHCSPLLRGQPIKIGIQLRGVEEHAAPISHHRLCIFCRPHKRIAAHRWQACSVFSNFTPTSVRSLALILLHRPFPKCSVSLFFLLFGFLTNKKSVPKALAYHWHGNVLVTLILLPFRHF